LNVELVIASVLSQLDEYLQFNRDFLIKVSSLIVSPPPATKSVFIKFNLESTSHTAIIFRGVHWLQNVEVVNVKSRVWLDIPEYKTMMDNR
jgi:hypothetical protein